MPRAAVRARSQAETLHALAHPLRLRILEELRKPASAAEVARRLTGESRQNVNYHLKALERGGLVRRAGTRRAGALTETLYEAKADGVVVTGAGPVALPDCDDGPGEIADPLPGGRWQGAVHSLHVGPAAGAPLSTVDRVRAVAGRGLEGDRYFEGTGTFSRKPGTGRHLTLIELETLRALAADGIALDPAEARRNVVTCGVPLNHLVGRELRIGSVVLRGMRLCEPCTYLSGLVGRDVKTGLIHRGGLRADIVRGGTIRAGAAVRPC
jgi:DNA-binding transcriptional ArsR family regulator